MRRLVMLLVPALALGACTEVVEPTRVPAPAVASFDEPHDRITVSGSVPAKGWALHPQGAIQRVEFLLDGRVVGAAEYGHERADVCRVHRDRPGCPNVGWQGTVDLAGATPGEHQLRLRITGPLGDRTETPPRVIVVAEAGS